MIVGSFDRYDLSISATLRETAHLDEVEGIMFWFMQVDRRW